MLVTYIYLKIDPVSYYFKLKVSSTLMLHVFFSYEKTFLFSVSVPVVRIWDFLAIFNNFSAYIERKSLDFSTYWLCNAGYIEKKELVSSQ